MACAFPLIQAIGPHSLILLTGITPSLTLALRGLVQVAWRSGPRIRANRSHRNTSSGTAAWQGVPIQRAAAIPLCARVNPCIRPARAYAPAVLIRNSSSSCSGGRGVQTDGNSCPATCLQQRVRSAHMHKPSYPELATPARHNHRCRKLQIKTIHTW